MSSSQEILLSIVVPTKNRPETLSVLIETVLAWDSAEVELVVQDNSDCNQDLMRRIGARRADERLSYFWSNEPLSAVENCDAAVRRARGEFVTFIGDDDGALRQIIDVVRWMNSQNVDALYCAVGMYTWPDMDHAIRVNYQYNGLLLNRGFRGSVSFINPQRELSRLLFCGGQSMYLIPRLYQGIVRKSVLDAMLVDLGTYFPGPVPDMSNAVAMTPYVIKFAYTDVPVIVSGVSRKSMSGKNANRQHQGDIRQEKSIPSTAFEHWTDQIPKYWCAPTIWGEAALKARQRTEPNYRFGMFGFANLYASCFAFTRKSYYPQIIAAMRRDRNPLQLFLIVVLATACFLLISIKRAKILCAKYLFGLHGSNFATIADALLHLENKVEKSNRFWYEASVRKPVNLQTNDSSTQKTHN